MPDEPGRIVRGLLTIRSEQQDAHFVSLSGELDLASAKALEAEFIRIEATSVSRIVVDLSELEFMDSTGIAVIMRAHKRAQNDGHVLRVLRPNGQVGRVFEICDLDEVLAFGN
jgi:anti-sigma B factor antagonist